MIEYRIIQSDDAELFQYEMEGALNRGWVVCGELRIVLVSHVRIVYIHELKKGDCKWLKN